MRINIFRNPYIDAQLGYLMDSLVHARRKETEEYWRTVIAEEIRDACPDYKERGIACIDCIETIEIIWLDTK